MWHSRGSHFSKGIRLHLPLTSRLLSAMVQWVGLEQWFSTGNAFYLPGDFWKCLVIFLNVARGTGKQWVEARMLLNILWCVWKFSMWKTYPAPNINRAEADKRTWLYPFLAFSQWTLPKEPHFLFLSVPVFLQRQERQQLRPQVLESAPPPTSQVILSKFLHLSLPQSPPFSSRSHVTGC